jgi:glycerol-3-phosphate dehydrogenase
MVAMASRPIHSILNRCKPPSDGDIIIPVGTVIVLGTTDEPVSDPTDLKIEPWEIDLLIAEAEYILPGLRQLRVLRAWAGIRPLYSPGNLPNGDSRSLTRGHLILDHEQSDGCSGLVSIIGGKLTTFRLMAEETVDLICHRLGRNVPCVTRETPLSLGEPSYFQLPARLNQRHTANSPGELSEVICECEQVSRNQIISALEEPDNLDLDSIRRDLRLGMGPCQAGYCALRTFGILTETNPELVSVEYGISPFLIERWRGQRPVGWGHSLRQMDFSRRLYQELLGLNPEAVKT